MKDSFSKSDILLTRSLRHHKFIPKSLSKSNPSGLYEILKSEYPKTTYLDYKEKIEYDFNTGESLLSKHKTIFFASTSGMSGLPKIIPHTRPSMNNYLYAVTPTYFRILSKYWKFILKGKIVPIVGKKEDFKSPRNVSVGSMTGYMTKLFYQLFPFIYSYSPIEAEKLDTNERFDLILNSIMKRPISGILGSNPYLIRKMLERAKEFNNLSEQKIAYDTLTKLKFIACITGQPATYHAKQLTEYLDNRVDIFDYGVSASEASFTSGLINSEPLGTPSPCLNSLIEWVPVEAEPNYANVEIDDFIGCKVHPLLTSSNGFLRYKIGDEYQVEKRNNMSVLRFLKRTGDLFSVTFEKVTSENIEVVVTKFEKETKIKLADYICLVQKNSDDIGKYWFIISLKNARYVHVQRFLENYSVLIDRIFCQNNPEYRNARINNIGLIQSEIVCGPNAENLLANIRESNKLNLQSKPTNILHLDDVANNSNFQNLLMNTLS